VTVVLGLAALVVFALVAVSAVAVVGVIVPLPWLGLRTRGRSAVVAIGSLIVASAIGLGVALASPARSSASSARAPTSSSTAPAAAAPAAAVTPHRLEELRARLVRDVLSHAATVQQPGQGARIAVRFDIADGPTLGMTRGGAIRDLARIMRAADESDVDFNSLFVIGTANVVDVYGRAGRAQVLKAGYSRETLRKIDWRNFDAQNALRIADTSELDPPFK
jgi:hypothetical protein